MVRAWHRGSRQAAPPDEPMGAPACLSAVACTARFVQPRPFPALGGAARAAGAGAAHRGRAAVAPVQHHLKLARQPATLQVAAYGRQAVLDRPRRGRGEDAQPAGRAACAVGRGSVTRAARRCRPARQGAGLRGRAACCGRLRRAHLYALASSAMRSTPASGSKASLSTNISDKNALRRAVTYVLCSTVAWRGP